MKNNKDGFLFKESPKESIINAKTKKEQNIINN
jgi:hypothetical protein